MQLKQTILAFLIAPLTVPVTTILLLNFINIPVPLPGFILASSLIAYIITFTLGIPAFLSLQGWRLQSLTAYLFGGFILALIPSLILYFLLENLTIAIIIWISGVLEALTFYAIKNKLILKIRVRS